MAAPPVSQGLLRGFCLLKGGLSSSLTADGTLGLRKLKGLIRSAPHEELHVVEFVVNCRLMVKETDLT